MQLAIHDVETVKITMSIHTDTCAWLPHESDRHIRKFAVVTLEVRSESEGRNEIKLFVAPRNIDKFVEVFGIKSDQIIEYDEHHNVIESKVLA